MTKTTQTSVINYIINPLFILLFIALGLIHLPSAHGAECQKIGEACTNDTFCQQESCSECIHCEIQEGQDVGVCRPNNDLCNELFSSDLGPCRGAYCNSEAYSKLNSGCEVGNIALLGSMEQQAQLPAQCFYSAPSQVNEISCGNGSCEAGEGENCATCPADCLSLLKKPEDCQPGAAQLDLQCQTEGLICNDGDMCTREGCSVVLGEDPKCTVTAKACNHNFADGCCPAGCFGPSREVVKQGSEDPCVDTMGQNNPDLASCDLDCGPQTAACGNGLIEPAETCEDNILPNQVAGIDPNKNPVSNEQCRDPSTVDECTFCGDGKVQSSEECDGSENAACNGQPCLADCTCQEAGGGETTGGETTGGDTTGGETTGGETTGGETTGGEITGGETTGGDTTGGETTGGTSTAGTTTGGETTGGGISGGGATTGDSTTGGTSDGGTTGEQEPGSLQGSGKIFGCSLQK